MPCGVFGFLAFLLALAPRFFVLLLGFVFPVCHWFCSPFAPVPPLHYIWGGLWVVLVGLVVLVVVWLVGVLVCEGLAVWDYCWGCF